MLREMVSASGVEVGHHDTATWLGMNVNTDTIRATLVAAAITLVLAFILRARVTSTGVPTGVQLFWEAITVQMRSQIQSSMGLALAPFVLPFAVSLFVFILIANWLSVLPFQFTNGDGQTAELLTPPASDINFVLALALLVFVCYHAAGFKKSGVIGYPIKVAKGHVAFLAPINLVESLKGGANGGLRARSICLAQGDRGDRPHQLARVAVQAGLKRREAHRLPAAEHFRRHVGQLAWLIADCRLCE
jgi:F-type H+-transporting ATPase subunit a